VATKFSKRDYEFVRNTLIRYVPVVGRQDFHAPALLNVLIRDFAKQFALDNPRFDRDKFLKGMEV